MGRPSAWVQQFTGRSAMKSPGAPSHRQEVEREFWKHIATGITSEKAAEATGVSQAVGARWFRNRLCPQRSLPDTFPSMSARRSLCYEPRKSVFVK